MNILFGLNEKVLIDTDCPSYKILGRIHNIDSVDTVSVIIDGFGVYRIPTLIISKIEK